MPKKSEVLKDLRASYNSKSEYALFPLLPFNDVTSDDLFSVYSAGADKIVSPKLMARMAKVPLAA